MKLVLSFAIMDIIRCKDIAMDSEFTGVLKVENRNNVCDNTTSTLISRNKKKSKRFRSAFTTLQIAQLENEFKKDPYVTNARRQHLAQTLKLSERAVKIWFQNRRMKEKRDTSKEQIEMGSNVDNKNPVEITITEDMIRNLSSSTANQQTISTSLAMKIDGTNDETSKSVNTSYKNTPKHNVIKQVKHKNGVDVFMTNKGTHKTRDNKNLNVTKNVRPLNLKCPSQQKNSKNQTQPVGHILPFCQVSSNTLLCAQNAMDQQITKEKQRLSEKVPSYTLPQLLPVDMAKYYTPVQALAWNRLNFSPMGTGPQGHQLYTQQNTVPMNSGSSKCFCECHVTPCFESALGYPQVQPMFFTQYAPHFICPLPTNNASVKF